MTTTWTYAAVLDASAKANWRIQDVLPKDARLDFARRFLPECFARTDELALLPPDERLALNQIRGHGYLATFGLVEEFILPFVLDHARPRLGGDDHRVRALLQFAGEEAKHIHLFKEFRRRFEAGFGSPCEVIGPPEAIAAQVLAHSPLAVALTILHAEWMTQAHFTGSVRDDQDLDLLFRGLLRAHWMEEAQHAKIDSLLVEALGATMTQDEIAASVGEYLEILRGFDEGFLAQAHLDVASLERKVRRTLTAGEREEVVRVQHAAMRWTFLGSGMTHPELLRSLDGLGAGHRARVVEAARLYA
jgi:hypothetical protein